MACFTFAISRRQIVDSTLAFWMFKRRTSSIDVNGYFVKYFKTTDQNMVRYSEDVRCKWLRLLRQIEAATGYRSMNFLSYLNNEDVFHRMMNRKKIVGDSSSENFIETLLSKEPTMLLMSQVAVLFNNMQTADEKTLKNAPNLFHRQVMLIDSCDMAWFYLHAHTCIPVDMKNKNDQRYVKCLLLIGFYALVKKYQSLVNLRNGQIYRTIQQTLIEGMELSFEPRQYVLSLSPVSLSGILSNRIPAAATDNVTSRIEDSDNISTVWREQNRFKSDLFGLCLKSLFDLEFVSHPLDNRARLFGAHLALALQAYTELQYSLLNSTENLSSSTDYDVHSFNESADLLSEKDRTLLYSYKRCNLSIADDLINQHVRLATDQLKYFPECRSKELVEDLLSLLVPPKQNYSSL